MFTIRGFEHLLISVNSVYNHYFEFLWSLYSFYEQTDVLNHEIDPGSSKDFAYMVIIIELP